MRIGSGHAGAVERGIGVEERVGRWTRSGWDSSVLQCSDLSTFTLPDLIEPFRLVLFLAPRRCGSDRCSYSKRVSRPDDHMDSPFESRATANTPAVTLRWYAIAAFCSFLIVPLTTMTLGMTC